MEQPTGTPAASTRPPSQVVEVALEAVRRDGGRSTTTRRIVLEALVDAGDDGVTAEDLADLIRAQHPAFTSSTIYRCLDRFEELGIVGHAHLGHGPAVWRLVDQPRWYLVCTGCGRSMDADPALIERLSSQLYKSVGFRLDGHFALTGRCAQCATGPSGGSIQASSMAESTHIDG